MSIRVMSQVWEESEHSGGKLLVLLALADAANDEGICWPSIATLALKSRMSERNVQRLLRELELSGEIKTYTGGFLEGKRRANTYHVLPQGRQNVTPDESGAEGDNLGTERVTPTSPQPSKEPSLEPSSKPSSDGDAAATLPGMEPPPDESGASEDDVASDIFKLWQSVCDRQDADYSPARQRAAKKAARESSDLDEWAQIIKGFKIFRERKSERDGAKPKLEFTEIVATHPGSGDLRSRLEFFKEQDDGTVHHDTVPSLLHDRITRRQVQVVEMFQQPDSRAVRERGEEAQRWLRENAGLVPVYDEQDGRVTWERVTT
jgi:hypothetical protein